MYQPEIERINDDLYFVAASPAMRRLRTQAELLAQTDVPVLVVGERGSGKSTAARLIHALSLRSSFPFVTVKCSALTADMLESELFGYEYDGNGGRPEGSAGKFEQCAQGTILLDEFDVMPSAVQQRLLRVLETGELVRCGGQKPMRADVRIMVATANDLEAATLEKRLREELFYRLSAFELRVPPLRERREEIPLLLGHVMSRLTRRYGVPAPRLSGTLLEVCQRYSWPGNLRELENFAKRYLARTDEEAAMRELQESPGYGSDAKIGNGSNGKGSSPSNSGQNGEERSSLKSVVRTAKGDAERAAIAAALEETHWNRKAAARLLNVSYRALLYKIQEYHLIPPGDSLPRIFGGNGLEAK